MLPLTTRQREAIESIPRLSLASECWLTLEIAGVDYTVLAEDITYGGENPEDSSGDSGPAVVLQANINADIPQSTVLEECRVYWRVAGERILGLIGRLVDVQDVEGKTGVLIATSGHDLGDTSLDEDMEFVSVQPNHALYQVLAKIGYRGIEIESVTKPRFTRSGEDKFFARDKVSGVTEAIREECGLAVYDSLLDVARGWISGVASESVWRFTERVDFEYGSLSVTDPQEKRYARVIAWQPLPDGSWRKAATALVDNHGIKVSQNSTYDMEITDTDTESPWEMVRRQAEAFSAREVALEWPIEYSPFWLERGDSVEVVARKILTNGIRERVYAVRLSKTVINAKDGTLGGMGRLLSERVVEKKRPSIVPSNLQIAHALFGTNYLDEPYISSDLPGVSLDVDGDVVLNVDTLSALGISVYLDPTDTYAVIVKGL